MTRRICVVVAVAGAERAVSEIDVPDHLPDLAVAELASVHAASLVDWWWEPLNGDSQ